MFFSTLSHFIAGLRLHIVTFLLFWVFFFVNSTAAREEKLCKFPCKSRYAVFIHTATNDSLIEKLHLVFPTAHHRNLFSSNASPSPTSLPTHPSPSTFPQLPWNPMSVSPQISYLTFMALNLSTSHSTFAMVPCYGVRCVRYRLIISRGAMRSGWMGLWMLESMCRGLHIKYRIWRLLRS